jgi:hypothetical protein
MPESSAKADRQPESSPGSEMNEREYHEQLRIENEVLRRTLANMQPGTEKNPKFDVESPSSEGDSAMK